MKFFTVLLIACAFTLAVMLHNYVTAALLLVALVCTVAVLVTTRRK